MAGATTRNSTHPKLKVGATDDQLRCAETFDLAIEAIKTKTPVTAFSHDRRLCFSKFHRTDETNSSVPMRFAAYTVQVKLLLKR